MRGSISSVYGSRFSRNYNEENFSSFPFSIILWREKKIRKKCIIRKIVLSSLERMKFETHFDN